MNLKRLHYFSGCIFSVFIVTHLWNHAMSLFGVECHITLMNALRRVYRNPIIETMLITVVLIQIVSGLKLFLRKRREAETYFRKLQFGSGLYLAFFLAVHLCAVLGGRYYLNLDTNFYFGAAGLNHFPQNLFFIPYYGLAIVSIFGHIAAFHAQKMKLSFFGLGVEHQFKIILGLGFIVTFGIFYGLTQGFSGIVLPKPYEVLIGK